MSNKPRQLPTLRFTHQFADGGKGALVVERFENMLPRFSYTGRNVNEFPEEYLVWITAVQAKAMEMMTTQEIVKLALYAASK